MNVNVPLYSNLFPLTGAEGSAFLWQRHDVMLSMQGLKFLLSSAFMEKNCGFSQQSGNLDAAFKRKLMDRCNASQTLSPSFFKTLDPRNVQLSKLFN